MTTQQQAYALSLSDELLKGMWVPNVLQNESALRARAAQELRRLHAENERLRAGYDAARLEIESLKERVQQLGQLARDVNSRRVVELEAQLAAVGAGGVEPLRERECLHQISEPAQPVGWAIFAENGNGLMWTQSRQNAEATAKDIGLQVTPLYAAQAASVDATVQRDAARYRFLRDGEWRRTDLESVIRLQLNTLWDSHIDAAIAAKKGEKS